MQLKIFTSPHTRLSTETAMFPNLNPSLGLDAEPVEFDGIVYDPTTNTLSERTSGVSIKVPPPARLLMRMFAANLGKLIPAQTLQDRLNQQHNPQQRLQEKDLGHIMSVLRANIKTIRKKGDFDARFDGHYRLGAPRWHTVLNKGNLKLDLEAFVLERGKIQAQLHPTQMRLMIELMEPEERKIDLQDHLPNNPNGVYSIANSINQLFAGAKVVYIFTRRRAGLWGSLFNPDAVRLDPMPEPQYS
jgi:DNA-binding response OmpR family regulator